MRFRAEFFGHFITGRCSCGKEVGRWCRRCKRPVCDLYDCEKDHRWSQRQGLLTYNRGECVVSMKTGLQPALKYKKDRLTMSPSKPKPPARRPRMINTADFDPARASDVATNLRLEKRYPRIHQRVLSVENVKTTIWVVACDEEQPDPEPDDERDD